jgi:hypothetical protein
MFGVPKGRCIRSHSVRHCIGRVGRSFDRPPHGPCHRPPSPLHHDGEARTPQGPYLVEPSPHPGVSGVGVRGGPRVVPRRSERTSRLALRSVSVGRTPNDSHLISAIKLASSTTPEGLSLAIPADEQYHEPSLQRCVPALKGEALAPVPSRYHFRPIVEGRRREHCRQPPRSGGWRSVCRDTNPEPGEFCYATRAGSYEMFTDLGATP